MSLSPVCDQRCWGLSCGMDCISVMSAGRVSISPATCAPIWDPIQVNTAVTPTGSTNEKSFLKSLNNNYNLEDYQLFNPCVLVIGFTFLLLGSHSLCCYMCKNDCNNHKINNFPFKCSFLLNLSCPNMKKSVNASINHKLSQQIWLCWQNMKLSVMIWYPIK